ncbi:hypothetical protein BpHYR1_012489 [Brachionus plicatilis]|uniref:Uncharacterized protein n=1 Tax=Brachionus plicatilis TaxID=10195 RepID=A0A3M7SVR2_BRAPC|nr:hypothetical protein BpHYR1_012489 [Brachionus plicatilis]
MSTTTLSRQVLFTLVPLSSWFDSIILSQMSKTSDGSRNFLIQFDGTQKETCFFQKNKLPFCLNFFQIYLSTQFCPRAARLLILGPIADCLWFGKVIKWSFDYRVKFHLDT